MLGWSSISLGIGTPSSRDDSLLLRRVFGVCVVHGLGIGLGWKVQRAPSVWSCCHPIRLDLQTVVTPIIANVGVIIVTRRRTRRVTIVAPIVGGTIPIFLMLIFREGEGQSISMAESALDVYWIVG